MKTEGLIEFGVFVVIAIIVAIANIAKFIKENRGKKIDWGTVLNGNPAADGKPPQGKTGSGPDVQLPEIYYSNGEPVIILEGPVGFREETEASKAPEKPAEFKTPFKAKATGAEARPAHGDATGDEANILADGNYAEFIRHYGSSAIVLHEILGKPKALRE